MTGVRDRLAGLPLRTRLVAAVIALLAVVCLLIGGVTVAVLHRVLSNQLDRQVTDGFKLAKIGPAGYGGPPADGGNVQARGQCTTAPGPDFLTLPGNAPGTIGLTISATGQISAGRVVVSEGGACPQSISSADQQALAAMPADDRLYTVTLDDLGRYRVTATRFGDEVRMIALPLHDVDTTTYGLALVVALLAAAGMLATGSAGAIIIQRTLRPLNRVAATAAKVTELPLDRGEVVLSVRVPDADTDTRTEVGQVGAALNRMLGHVDAALAARHENEIRVRQFLADASHELRTPLAAIRGYAELTRRGRDIVSPDLAHAMGRVESEAARMTSLVDDLLLLARLDSGRPLENAPVDLTRLVVDAISDARVAGPEHRWRLVLPDSPVMATGDALRLTQVLTNLLANARVHTPPGTTVTASLAVDEDMSGGAGAVRLSVADDGPGIPAELVPQVFERFARGDSSRSRTAGSTGLGLSIAAAVVDAHGGDITVASEPGHTVFVVTLPLCAVPQPSQPRHRNATTTA